jgi:hypothetical protein
VLGAACEEGQQSCDAAEQAYVSGCCTSVPILACPLAAACGRNWSDHLCGSRIRAALGLTSLDIVARRRPRVRHAAAQPTPRRSPSISQSRLDCSAVLTEWAVADGCNPTKTPRTRPKSNHTKRWVPRLIGNAWRCGAPPGLPRSRSRSYQRPRRAARRRGAQRSVSRGHSRVASNCDPDMCATHASPAASPSSSSGNDSLRCLSSCCCRSEHGQPRACGRLRAQSPTRDAPCGQCNCCCCNWSDLAPSPSPRAPF